MTIFKNIIQRPTFSSIINYSTKREDKLLSQMLNRKIEKLKGKKTNFNPVLLNKRHLLSAYDNVNCSKRAANLNKLYMEEISSIINSGNFMSQFEDLGVEITKVNFAKGLNFLSIYWKGTKPDIDEDVLNETLTKAAAELQQEMGSIRFTSGVPYLKFVRDLRLEDEIKLNEIFESADFGKDFEPIYKKKVLTPSFISERGGFPKMRQDLLGLDHENTEQNIKDKLLKFKAIRIDPPTEVAPEFPEKLIKFTRNEFFKFFKRRRILELKLRKKFGKNFTDEIIDDSEEVNISHKGDEEDYADDDEVYENSFREKFN